MKCRHCYSEDVNLVLDLGYSAPSNAYLSLNDLHKPEITFPLRIAVCKKCWLVQTEDYSEAESLFKEDYAYFSSTSSSWVKHAKEYCEKIQEIIKLNANSFVIEIASNDGYLLKNFKAAGVPCLGVEPTKSTAEVAKKKGIQVVEKFFNKSLAKEISEKYSLADLIVGNNVYAHVPDINNFTLGMKILLKKNGVITLEFPHVLNLLKHFQFDTIYHEHFSYLSLHTVVGIMKNAGLRVWDVEKIDTHGGSLRIYCAHLEAEWNESSAVSELLEEETRCGIQNIETYQNLQYEANRIKYEILEFLISMKKANKKIVAFGAAAKGNTLINFCGISRDLIEYVCDNSPAKQNKYLPGSHIPIKNPSALKNSVPDYIIIFSWNIMDEIIQNTLKILNNKVKFVTFIPRLNIFDKQS